MTANSKPWARRRMRWVVATAAVLTALTALRGETASVAAPQPPVPRTWAGQATWKHEVEDDTKWATGERRNESHFAATMRLTFGKAPRYAATYQVKSGTLTWTAPGSAFERLAGIAETTCSWSLSRKIRLSRYAGTLEVTQDPSGARGVFSAADTYGRPVRTPETCTRKYLTSHNPPVETETLSYDVTAPNPLFLLSRKTAGLPARGRPPVISGSDRMSSTQHPPSGPGTTVTHRDSSRWSWRFTGRA